MNIIRLDHVQKVDKIYRENEIIPESVLQAEKVLKSDYPLLWYKIMHYRNSPNLQYPDLVKIQVHTATAGFSWEKYGKLIMRFINANEREIKSEFMREPDKPKINVVKKKKQYQVHLSDPGTRYTPAPREKCKGHQKIPRSLWPTIIKDKRHRGEIAFELGVTPAAISYIRKQGKAA